MSTDMVKRPPYNPRPVTIRTHRTHFAAGLLMVISTIASPVSGQGLPSEPLVFAGGRVTVSGDASLTLSCADNPGPGSCADDEGFFNYSGYEHSTLRMLRLAVNASVRANRYISLLTEVRSENGDTPQAYALYVRVRPWEKRDFAIHAGRVPPTFGAFSRRNYPSDNLLIGYPLAYQYLTSLRADAIPATADELIRMRGRGWLSSYSLGNTTADEGLPLATAFQWDTGIQLHGALRWLELTGAVTTGSLSHPLVGDDNDGRHVVGRVTLRPLPGLIAGLSASRAAFLARSAATSAGPEPSGRFPQTAVGLDLEYSRDYYLVRIESVLSGWSLPTLDQPLRAGAVSVEGRYKFLPAWYLAGRVDHLGFSSVTGSTRTTTWDADVTRVEAGVGYRIRRNLQLKTSLQHNVRDGGRVRRLNIGAVQAVVWF